MLRIRKVQLALGPWRYLIALAGSAAGVGLRFVAGDFLQGYGFITIFPVIVISALLLGWKAGALVLVTGAGGVWYFVLPERFSFYLPYANDAVALSAFVTFGTVIVWAASAFERLLLQVEAERQEAERQASRNQMLLLELKHRVGNVLQLVLALLAVRRRSTGNPEARRVVEDAIGSIRLLARGQDALYSGDDTRIGSLLEEVCRSVTQAAPHVDCRVEAIDASLPADAVVPLLLIANEMLMNAVEHAFVGRSAGSVIVRLAAEPDVWKLSVCDDGIGVPADFSPEQGPRQGLKIIAALTRQIGARFGIERRRDSTGTTAWLLVPRTAQAS